MQNPLRITIGGDYLTIQIDNIPTELRALPQWVLRREKVPYNPRTGQKARAGDPSTWTTFSETMGALERGNWDGIGFQFATGGGLVGIDLDHVVNPNTGEVQPWALDIVHRMDSYTEYSPSGTGLHIFVYGELPQSGRKKIINKETGEAVELYKEGRYFTVTALPFLSSPIARPSEELAALYAELFPEKSAQIRPVSVIPAPEYLRIGLDKDSAFRALWNGKRASRDESSNDMALMNKLAYWCNRDEEQMVKAFISSPHAQQKDDDHRSKLERKDYLRRTAQKAIADCGETAAEHNQTYLDERASNAAGEIAQGIEFSFIDPIESPSTMRRYTLDDIGTARLFADTFRDRLLYLPEYKDWFVYERGRWVQDKGELRVHALAKTLADYVRSIIPSPPQPDSDSPSAKPDDPWAKCRKYYNRYRSLNNRKTLIQDAKPELRGSATEFDCDPYLFNCQNGTLDLRTGELRPHNPLDRISKQAAVDYAPEARSPRFVQFIEEITEGDTARAGMLQKALGYSMKGEANEECYFTAIGEQTRNGKGTLFDTMLHLFGSYGAQMDFATVSKGNAVKDGSKPTPDLARLAGVRLVLANEPEKGVYLNEALIKQLTGNDDIVSRPLYGDILQFKPVFKLFISANSKPNVSDDSLFASGRIKLLPFTRHFEEHERDRTLKSKLREPESMSGILNWLLDGYRLYCAEGLKDTEEMKRLVGEYRWENDYIGQYLAERVELTHTGKEGRIAVRNILNDYRNWCGPVGIKPVGLKMFKGELSRRGIEVYDYGRVLCVNARLKYDFYSNTQMTG